MSKSVEVLNIKKRIETNMKAGIMAALNGDIAEFESSFIHPEMVCNYLESEGWEKGDLDINGWQYDWWIPFTKDGKIFTAGGSGYYGTFQFSQTEE